MSKVIERISFEHNVPCYTFYDKTGKRIKSCNTLKGIPNKDYKYKLCVNIDRYHAQLRENYGTYENNIQEFLIKGKISDNIEVFQITEAGWVEPINKNIYESRKELNV